MITKVGGVLPDEGCLGPIRSRSAESAQFAESVNGAAEPAWHTASLLLENLSQFVELAATSKQRNITA
ncbi:MAG: hypothetical protein CBE43_06585 [Rhodopirellula sp. TMED283]|nr:MAG: hypothetical protein CBE43_06585 [Rhodopirellula sp. TMED283]